MEIRPYQTADWQEWLRMRRSLWPDIGPEQEKDASDWLAQPHTVTLVVERPNGLLAGFAEIGTRVWAEGCESSPVAYLEGWYVDPDARHCGIGAALIRAAEVWAKQKRLYEMASDAQVANTASHSAHLAVGFAEVERVVLYQKVLGMRGRSKVP